MKPAIVRTNRGRLTKLKLWAAMGSRWECAWEGELGAMRQLMNLNAVKQKYCSLN